MPVSHDSPGGLLSQIASVSGLNFSSQGNLEEHYGRILTSNSILDALLKKKWVNGGEEGTLMEILAMKGGATSDSAKVYQRFRNYLRQDIISFERKKSTGFMEMKVSIPERPILAAQVANSLAMDLKEFVGDISREQAGEQRVFVENRVAETRAELALAENSLVEFKDKNRSYLNSPELELDFIRLRREVEVLTTVWVELRRQLELLRIDESKDVSPIQILDFAEIPASKSAPRRLAMGGVGFLFGLAVVGFLLVLSGMKKTSGAA